MDCGFEDIVNIGLILFLMGVGVAAFFGIVVVYMAVLEVVESVHD